MVHLYPSDRRRDQGTTGAGPEPAGAVIESPYLEMEVSVKVGDVARTPFEPSGLVKILGIHIGGFFDKNLAFVEYLEDHPYGYKKGETGNYFLNELKPAVLALEDDS